MSNALNSLNSPLRALVLAAALAFAAQTADARSTAPDPPRAANVRGTARSESDAVQNAPDGVPVDGVVIILGIVGVVIVLAWVCSRFGDSR